MRMAFGATHRQAEPADADRADAVDDLLQAILFEIDAGLGVPHRVAQESRSPFVLGSPRRGSRSLGQLLDGEAIERDVAVDGVNDPIAVEIGVFSEKPSPR